MSDDSDDPAAVPATYADWAADRTEPRFTDWLRARSGEAWSAATRHQFARRVHADTIDDVVFRRYLLQAYAVVETLLGASPTAWPKTPTSVSTKA